MRALLPLLIAISPLSALGQADVDLSGASAARPGDENLTCDQLKAEMTAVGQQSNVAAVMQQQTAAARQQMMRAAAEANAATSRQAAAEADADSDSEPAADAGRGRGGSRRGAGAGDGGGGGGFGRALGNAFGRNRTDEVDAAAAAQREAAASEPAAVEQSPAPSFDAGSPGMQRSFRLMELAQAKKCAFLDEGAPPRAPR